MGPYPHNKIIDKSSIKIMRHYTSPSVFKTSKIDDMQFGYSLFGEPYEEEAHKVFCQKNSLDPEEVFYVRQGRCEVSRKKLITTNLKVCSALAIRIDDVNILAHIDADEWINKIVDPIRNFLKKDSLAELNINIQCKLFLGDIPGIHPDTLHALNALGILNKLINLKELQADVSRYLIKRLEWHISVGIKHGLDLTRLYLESEKSEYHDIIKFLNLTEISTNEEITLCTDMLNSLLEDPDFSMKKRGMINFVQPETIVGTDDLNTLSGSIFSNPQK